MNRLRRAVFGLSITAAICSLAPNIAQAADNKDSSQEFSKAADLTDIRSPASPPFELDAKLNVYGGNGAATPGSYKLIWLSPDEWREELTYGGYTRVRVGGKDEYWQQRSIDYESLQIHELSLAIDFASSLRNEKSPGKLRSRKESGGVLDCADGSSQPQMEYCFDPAQGTLALEQTISGPATMPYRFQYSNFVEFGQKRFPGTIQVATNKTPLADFFVERLVNIDKTNAPDFVPPAGASAWLTCSDPENPVAVNRVSPDYPATERLARHQGIVVIYALIATDGSVHNLQVLGASWPGLADAALAAVRQWRYKPRRCGGTPTPAETIIYSVFTLG